MNKQAKSKQVMNRKKKTAPRGNRSTSRVQRGSSLMQQGSITRTQAPVTLGVIQRQGMFGWRFGAAAPHDEFVEGGLRIAGVLPPGTNSSTLTQPVAATNPGLFGPTGGYAAAVVTPTGNSTASAVNLFDSAGPLALFAQFFRKFRFRKLTAQVDSMITTSGALGANGGATVLGSPIIQLSFEKDPWVADQLSTATYTIDTAVQSRCTTRFNAWANDVMCPLIESKSADKADELFFISPAATALVDSNSADLRQTAQGAVLAMANVNNSLAALKLSKVLIHFEVDLYGFTNTKEVIDTLAHQRIASAKSARGLLAAACSRDQKINDLAPERGSSSSSDEKDFELIPLKAVRRKEGRVCGHSECEDDCCSYFFKYGAAQKHVDEPKTPLRVVSLKK